MSKILALINRRITFIYTTPQFLLMLANPLLRVFAFDTQRQVYAFYFSKKPQRHIIVEGFSTNHLVMPE